MDVPDYLSEHIMDDDTVAAATSFVLVSIGEATET